MRKKMLTSFSSGRRKDPAASTPGTDSSADLRVVRPRRAAPADAARVTRAEINLAHVRHNLHELRASLSASAQAAGRGPARIWAVLKADGYGHGAAAVAMTLEQAGVDGVCVALLEEGLELRSAGVRGPILIMSGSHGRRRDGLEALIDHRLTPVVFDHEQIDALATTQRYMVSTGKAEGALAVHLKVDTGMGRLGVRDNELEGVLAVLAKRPELELGGLMTHLACADADTDEITRHQLSRFEVAASAVGRAGFPAPVKHAANSAALLRWPETHFDVVRPGIALFGVHPCQGSSLPPSSDEGSRPREGRAAKLKPVMSVLSEIIALRELPIGASLGYGHTWTAARASRVATVPIGYADGLSRLLSNRGAVLIGGRRAPIIGAVSMDLIMVDATDLPQVSVRDEVVVLGEQKGRFGSDCITAHELAELTGTISWECLTSVSRRVPRFYRHP
jgi:alanine racemase